MRNDRRANIPSCECISQQAPASRCRLQVLAYGHRVPDQCVDALQLGPTTARRVSSGSVKARNAPEQQAAREWWSRPPSAGSRKASTEKCFGSRRGEEARSSKYRATHPPATAAPHCAETAKLSGCICAACRGVYAPPCFGRRPTNGGEGARARVSSLRPNRLFAFAVGGWPSPRRLGASLGKSSRIQGKSLAFLT